MAKYKFEVYKGYRIVFEKSHNLILAKAPALTRQYIGSGKTKAAALRDARKSIDTITKK